MNRGAIAMTRARHRVSRLAWAKLYLVMGTASGLLVSSAAVWAQPRPDPRAASAATAAQAAEIEGVVLAVQDQDLVIDIGSSRGATVGASATLWRPIKLKHPVTGKLVVDRFRLGPLELTQVRPSMSLAREAGQLSRTPQVGDVVLFTPVVVPEASAATPPSGVAAGKEPASAPEPQKDPEAAAVSAIFDDLHGADLVTRIRRYEDYVRTNPEGRFARVLYEEAAALRSLLQREEKEKQAQPRVERFEGAREVVSGGPLRLAIELNDVATGAVLHVRSAGEPAYVSLPMSSAGPGYFAAQVPAEKLKPPTLEYFIEATHTQGEPVAVVGKAESPRRVDVLDAVRPVKPRKLVGMVEVLTDYADYNRFLGNDRVWQTEGTFGVRIGDTGVRAVRSGFGVYRGVGGTVRDLDVLNLKPREVGLTYGYLEAEFGVVPAFSVIGRLAVGLRDEGVGGGGQLLLRIGSDLGTNLLLGGELLGGVGLRSITQLEWKSFERFPILLRIEVTNQPAGFSSRTTDADTSSGDGDVGGRGIVQVGFRVTPALLVAARGSFQGRTIQHAGPGFGGAVGYTW